mgnify:FL=1
MKDIKVFDKSLTPVVVFALLCLLLKILIPLFFPLSRIIMYITLAAFFIFLIVFCARRKNGLMQKIISVLIFSLVLAFSFLITDIDLDKAYLKLFERQYTEAAEELAEKLSTAEDTDWGTYELKFPRSLLTRFGNEVIYKKEGDRLLISFITVYTLFDIYTYTYFPEPDCAELISSYDYFEWINEHWAYVQLC